MAPPLYPVRTMRESASTPVEGRPGSARIARTESSTMCPARIPAAYAMCGPSWSGTRTAYPRLSIIGVNGGISNSSGLCTMAYPGVHSAPRLSMAAALITTGRGPGPGAGTSGTSRLAVAAIGFPCESVDRNMNWCRSLRGRPIWIVDAPRCRISPPGSSPSTRPGEGAAKKGSSAGAGMTACAHGGGASPGSAPVEPKPASTEPPGGPAELPEGAAAAAGAGTARRAAVRRAVASTAVTAAAGRATRACVRSKTGRMS